MPELTLSGRYILVAEDEYMIAMDQRRDLRAEGAIVLGPTSTLEKAIDLIEAESRIDAALLDINLNGEQIFPAADILRERGVPFLFSTGYDQGSIPPRFASVPVCIKPLENSAIVAALRQLISTLHTAP